MQSRASRILKKISVANISLPVLSFGEFCNNLNIWSPLLVYSTGVLPALSLISNRQPWLTKRPMIVWPIVVLRISKSFTRMCNTVSPLHWEFIFDGSIMNDDSKNFKNSALPARKEGSHNDYYVLIFCIFCVFFVSFLIKILFIIFLTHRYFWHEYLNTKTSVIYVKQLLIFYKLYICIEIFCLFKRFFVRR